MEIIILECPRCSCIKKWRRSRINKCPGECHCKTFQMWRVLKEEPKSWVCKLDDMRIGANIYRIFGIGASWPYYGDGSDFNR